MSDFSLKIVDFLLSQINLPMCNCVNVLIKTLAKDHLQICIFANQRIYSAPHILVLKGNAKIPAFGGLDHRLKIIYFLSCHSHQVIIDRSLYF